MLDYFKNLDQALNILEPPVILNTGGHHKTWRIKTQKEGEVFCKEHYLPGFDYLLNISEQKRLYNLMEKDSIGLKLLYFDENFIVFPYIPSLHNGYLNPSLLAQSVAKLHNLPLSFLPIPLIPRIEFYLNETKEYLDQFKSSNVSFLYNLLDYLNPFSQKKIVRRQLELLFQKSYTLDILDLKNTFTQELALCHCDINPYNLIWNEEQVLLIDVEYAGVTDIYFDLANIYSFLNTKDFSIFIQEYSKQRVSFHFQQEKLDVYLQCRTLMKQSWEIWIQTLYPKMYRGEHV